MIPKYFMVKRDDSPEWNQYISWLNNTYKVNWSGDMYKYYGFGSSNSNNGTLATDNVGKLYDTPKLFTAKEFLDLLSRSKLYELY